MSATRARGLKRGRSSLDRGLRKLEVGSQKAARSLSKGFQYLCIEGGAHVWKCPFEFGTFCKKHTAYQCSCFGSSSGLSSNSADAFMLAGFP